METPGTWLFPGSISCKDQIIAHPEREIKPVPQGTYSIMVVTMTMGFG
ncbi:hypothetical protein [Desulfoplanes formicivorans]|nr:hypothetical protein [Desulfoplanes formicivorans]